MCSKREWKCKRCEEPINILVLDSERKFKIDGENIFCGIQCLKAFKSYIPVSLAKVKTKEKRSPKLKKITRKSEYKCFNCGKIYSNLTWNKMCSVCFSSEKDLTNEKLSNIRLSKL